MSKSKLVIMRGASGVGKTTFVDKYLLDNEYHKTTVFRTNDYFMQNGVFVFNKEKLSQAHTDCFARFIRHVESIGSNELLILDNTNMNLWEISPYIMFAEVHGIQFQIIDLMWKSGINALAKRNVHGAKFGTIMNQLKNHSPALPWWPSSVVEVSQEYGVLDGAYFSSDN